MKTILASFFLIAGCWLMSGCESDMPPEPRTERPIVRGLTGHGKVVPPDNQNDPMINSTPGAGN